MRFLHSTARFIAALAIVFLPLAANAQISIITGSWSSHSAVASAAAALTSSAVVQALPMPVLFGVAPSDLTPNFGDPRDGGRTHEGEDIMAVKGTPIVSPTAGVVLRTEVGDSEGNAVYVAAPGGYTYVFMHLDHFGEGVVAGTQLQPGSLIGYVGDTGDAAGGPAHLHFEVHDTSDTPIDPMPFLTAEFTPAQKIQFLTTILGETSDPTALSQFLVSNFRGYFLADESSGIALPAQITAALSTSSANSAASTASVTSGDLAMGAKGDGVVALQQFLIAKASGPAGVALAGAGATGNLGSMTEAALIEYQKAAGIAASGTYDAATQKLVDAGAGASIVATTLRPAATSSAAISSSATNTASASAAQNTLSLTRDLERGMTGSDVLALQVFLNTHGFTVAASGDGSLGHETDYFGPATTAAVAKYQAAHAIAPAVGYVGPLTRASLATAA